jgi:hypothetical protein
LKDSGDDFSWQTVASIIGSSFVSGLVSWALHSKENPAELSKRQSMGLPVCIANKHTPAKHEDSRILVVPDLCKGEVAAHVDSGKAGPLRSNA